MPRENITVHIEIEGNKAADRGAKKALAMSGLTRITLYRILADHYKR